MSNAALLAFPSGSTSPDSRADESPALFGRDHEVRELEIALERASEGQGGALVLRGDAGIGTSALLAALRRTATSRGIPVLSARGVQSESSIPFAGLQELLLPLLGQVDRLQRPQRSTLSAALGFGNTLGEPSRSDVFGIALATIDLLRITTSEPRLLAVDDAHSLDSQTLGVLAFVARRLGQQPCLIAFAARSTFADPFASADLPEMAIDALGNDAARELLAATAPRLPRCVQRGLLSAAAGNPLAIVELARAISPLRDAGLSSGSAFPLSDRLVKAFAGSVAELAPATQALLLVASADPDCGVSELLDAARAASDQPVSVQSIQEAVDAGVVDMDATGIRFRYPLAGAAIYQRASIAERAKAHASLAAVVDDDPARRARHRAAAAVEPDEAVFSELVGAAATAHRCGEALGALTGLLRASGLTRDRERRAEVLLRAGEIAYELGDRRTALNLIARTDSGGRGPSGHGRLMAVRGVVEPTDPVESAHIEVLCRAADDARAPEISSLHRSWCHRPRSGAGWAASLVATASWFVTTRAVWVSRRLILV